MHNEFAAIVEQDCPWYIAYCAEVPGANGQGKSREECLADRREAITLPTPGRNSSSSDEARGAPHAEVEIPYKS